MLAAGTLLTLPSLAADIWGADKLAWLLGSNPGGSYNQPAVRLIWACTALRGLSLLGVAIALHRMLPPASRLATPPAEP